jgi:segregation and condensation protein A
VPEKKIPWWRKALHFALDTIRSGFGLFSHPANQEPGPEPEFSDCSEENSEEETALTDSFPKSEIAAVTPPIPAEIAAETAMLPAAAPEAVAEPEPELTESSKTEVEPAIEIALKQAAVDEAKPVLEPTEIVAEAKSESDGTPVPEPLPTPEPVLESVTPVAASPSSPLPEPPPAAEPESASEPAPEPAAAPDAVAPLVLTPEPTAAEEAAEKADERAAAKQAAQQKKRDESSAQSPFSVVVGQVYDGPLDLLLDLIRKQDIDIYDIPIAKITSQFLAYVNQLKASDMDVAGEFIYTASLLIHIKSKMLLPREAKGPDDAGEDPRQELVERLLEHERFKEAAQMLQQKQMLEAATWSNPGISEFQDDVAAEPEIAADTVDLVRVFRDILERARKRPAFNVQEDSVTVGQMIQFLARRLTMEDKPVALHRLLSHTRSERALIAMFLALLELVRLQAVLLRQDRAFSEIFIKKHTNFDAAMNESLANAADDWR